MYTHADVTIGFEPAEYVVNEVDGQVELIVVLRNGTLEREVTVLFETNPGTATETGMYFI